MSKERKLTRPQGMKNAERLAFNAVLAALGTVGMLLVRIPLIPLAPWMLYDPGDIPALIASLFLGPFDGLLVLFVIALVQVLATGGSGFFGFIMHFVATGIFILVPHLFWRKKKTNKSLILGLVVSTLIMSVVMVFMNILIVPLFNPQLRAQDVLPMIMPILIPFNLIKGAINSVLGFLVYQALRRIYGEKLGSSKS